MYAIYENETLWNRKVFRWNIFLSLLPVTGVWKGCYSYDNVYMKKNEEVKWKTSIKSLINSACFDGYYATDFDEEKW